LRGGVSAPTLEVGAKEVGVSKTALYYNYPSKDALLFELIFGALKTHAKTVHEAVERAKDGKEALGALVRETLKAFTPGLEDFRLAFLHGQVASPGSVHVDAGQFARIRPLNELLLADTVKKLATDREQRPGGTRVEPRLMAFLGYLSAIGLLTMKGMVESLNDPLIHSDDQLIEGLSRIFETAAAA
jgi:AcrR family transcriptional regulator